MGGTVEKNVIYRVYDENLGFAQYERTMTAAIACFQKRVEVFPTLSSQRGESASKFEQNLHIDEIEFGQDIFTSGERHVLSFDDDTGDLVGDEEFTVAARKYYVDQYTDCEALD